MSTPTIRELCAKATAGPRKAHESLSTPGLFAVQGDKGPDIARCQYTFSAEANAQLIARLDPATVLAVVEALEIAKHRADNSGCFFAEERAVVTRALALLNGEKPEQP